jgi:hypothetical protein
MVRQVCFQKVVWEGNVAIRKVLLPTGLRTQSLVDILPTAYNQDIDEENLK